MTTVRIAYAEPRPGKLANGGFHTRGHLVVLADDAGTGRCRSGCGRARRQLAVHLVALALPTGEIVTAGAPEESPPGCCAAGASVTGVDIDMTEADADELTPRPAWRGSSSAALREPGTSPRVSAWAWPWRPPRALRSGSPTPSGPAGRTCTGRRPAQPAPGPAAASRPALPGHAPAAGRGPPAR